MASLNKVIIMGNAGRDPEVRYMPDGKAVANISIATTSKRKDKTSGESIEDTQWHRVQFFDRLAEIVGKYVNKGSPLYVEGRLKYGKYTDKDGIERNTTEIVATEIQLLGNRQQSDAAPAPRAAPRQNPAPAPKPSSGGSGFDDMPDCPF